MTNFAENLNLDKCVLSLSPVTDAIDQEVDFLSECIV